MSCSRWMQKRVCIRLMQITSDTPRWKLGLPNARVRATDGANFPLMLEDLYNYLYHQNVTGGIPLKGTGILVGLTLLASHLFALLQSSKVQALLKSFPRNYKWGVILLSIDFVWGMICLSNMDMGEFYNLRKWFLILVPVGFVLVLIFVQEFLAVRALGSLLLLVGGIVLEAAFLQPQMSRLLLPVIAYVWIIAGMYFVGMPYLMRDWVGWVTANEGRWKMASLGGVIYGAIVLIAAVLWY
jgi:hypothetical protein